MKVDAVVVAGGSGTRFGANKLLEPLLGKPVLTWSIAALLAADSVERVVVAGSEELAPAVALARKLGHAKRIDMVPGGARRRDSVEAGLRVCTTRYVAVHDGARPLVTPELVERVVAAAADHPGAVLAVPVTDSVKVVSSGFVVEHPDRTRLWAAQTPQVVLRQAWLDAAAMSDNDETDDTAMLDRLGLQCHVVEGDMGNMKITRPWDIAVAAAILDERGKP